MLPATLTWPELWQVSDQLEMSSQEAVSQKELPFV